jgi:2'-5' RNA ligase
VAAERPLRLFVAGELPGPAVSSLASWADQLRLPELRHVSEASLHITLAFLGPRPAEDVEALAAALAPVQPWPSELRIGRPLWLAPRRPHVLTVEIEDPEGALAAAQSAVVERLAGAAPGWRPETRAFRPHVTVARVRRGARVDPSAVELPTGPEPVPFALEAVTLFQSTLSPRGARYEPLARVRPDGR